MDGDSRVNSKQIAWIACLALWIVLSLAYPHGILTIVNLISALARGVVHDPPLAG